MKDLDDNSFFLSRKTYFTQSLDHKEDKQSNQNCYVETLAAHLCIFPCQTMVGSVLAFSYYPGTNLLKSNIHKNIKPAKICHAQLARVPILTEKKTSWVYNEVRCLKVVLSILDIFRGWQLMLDVSTLKCFLTSGFLSRMFFFYRCCSNIRSKPEIICLTLFCALSSSCGLSNQLGPWTQPCSVDPDHMANRTPNRLCHLSLLNQKQTQERVRFLNRPGLPTILLVYSALSLLFEFDLIKGATE